MSLYINNMWQAGKGPILESVNPATKQIMWCSKTASKADVDVAVESARNAQIDWMLIGHL